MTEMKELLKIDYELHKEVYRAIAVLLVVGMLFMGVFTFNMGMLMIVMSYTLEIDPTRNNYNLMIKTLPINNSQYITYRYLSSFIRLIFLVIVFMVLSMIVSLSQKTINIGNSDGFLLWINNLIATHNSIEANYITRLISEVFVAIITVCVLIMSEFTKYKSRKKKIFVFMILILVNTFVGSCISKDYTWVLYDFLGKFNVFALGILAIAGSVAMIYYSYNKSIELYRKSEIA